MYTQFLMIMGPVLISGPIRPFGHGYTSRPDFDLPDPFYAPQGARWW